MKFFNMYSSEKDVLQFTSPSIEDFLPDEDDIYVYTEDCTPIGYNLYRRRFNVKQTTDNTSIL